MSYALDWAAVTCLPLLYSLYGIVLHGKIEVYDCATYL